MTVRVSLVQVDCSETEEPAARVARVIAETAAACAEADLVVLPELWHVGAFDIDRARIHQEPIDGPLVSALRDVAADTETCLYAGSFAESFNGKAYNTAVLFGADGARKAVYRKIHLFGFSGGEAALMSAGTELVVVETPLGPTGLATCYDLRFPELFRKLVDRGAEAIVMASGWPQRRIAHWDVLTQARAIENQVWLAACNEVGSHGGVVLGGHSVIVDPWGSVVAQGGESECVVSAEVDPSAVAEARRVFPVLADRRL